MKSYTVKTSNKYRNRTLAAESLESRQLLTGQGVELPVASFVHVPDTILQPTSEGQISRAEIVDLNNDGQPDYAAASSGLGSTSISFFIANGSSVTNASSTDVTENYFDDIIHADINGDGFADVVAAGQNAVYTFLNQGISEGNVWLGMQLHERIRLVSRSLAAADLNGDGRDDLAIATEARVDVRLSNSQAKFTSGIWYTNGPGSKAVAIGDVNDDGVADMVVALAESQTAEVLLNDGEGFLASSQILMDVAPVQKLKLLDADGDAKLDLVAGGQNQEGHNFHIWPGTGAGTFLPSSSGYETIGAPRDFELGDVNEDGLLDFVIGHTGTFHHPIINNGPGGVSVLMGTAPGVFEPAIRVSTPGASAVEITQEADGPSIRAVREYNNVVSQLSWQDSLFTSARDYADELANPFARRATVLADFNADGIQDAFVAEVFVENHDGQLYVGQQDGSFTVSPLPLNAAWRVNELFAGDFNGDGVDDLGLRVNVGQVTSMVSMVSNGDGTFQAARTGVTPESFGNYQVVDMNNDGRDDLVGIEAIGINTWVVTAFADENGAWAASEDRLPLNNRFVSELQIQDFNQDGQLDVLATSFQGSEFAFGSAGGGFASASPLGLENSYYAVGDYNGDGLLDVAGANFGELQLSIGYGQANGSFDVQTSIALAEPVANAQGLQAIDIFDDGTWELVAFETDSINLLSINTAGGFDVSEHHLGFYPGHVTASDLTGDGLVDLFVSPPGMGFISSSPTIEVAILAGMSDGNFEPATNSAASFIDGQVQTIQTVNDQLEILLTHRSGLGKLIGTSDGGLNGDFNGDDSITPADIDLLCAASHAPNLTTGDIAKFDQNSDNQIDAADVDSWLENIAQTKKGDADLDGDIDFADFLQLSANFGAIGASWTTGDFDCNGEVGFSDFLLLSSNFNS